MTAAGAALVATGAACILLGCIWFLVNRHRSRRPDSPAWSAALANGDNVVQLNAKHRTSRGIEIYNPASRSVVDEEALALRARQHAESRLAASGGAPPLGAPAPTRARTMAGAIAVATAGDGVPADTTQVNTSSESRSLPVMVTGTSTPSGVAVVRALVAAGYEVVALDHDQLAPGLRLAQLGAVIPLASAPDFGITLAKVAEKTGARTLVPGDGAELTALQSAADVLAEAGVATWLPSPELIATCADRKSLSDTLVRFSPTRLSELLVAGQPSGRQFEADLLAGDPGNLVAAVPRWKLTTCGEETMAAETFSDDAVSSLLEAVCRSIDLEGPATVAGFVGDDDNAVITDVSLGFSSSVALSAAAGADIVVAYTKKLRGDRLPEAPMPYRSGVRMVRHLDEVFET